MHIKHIANVSKSPNAIMLLLMKNDGDESFLKYNIIANIIQVLNSDYRKRNN